MRRVLFPLATVLVFSLVFIVITAQKPPENRKFYYAFNEKVFIDKIPNKFAVKFKDKQKANALKFYLMEKIGNEKNIQSQNETTLIVDLNSTGKNINELLDSKMPDIEIIKPAYKYQKQEMYYTNEILVEALEGMNINEVIRKNGLENYVKVKEGKFYSIIEIFSFFDACEIANKIQESGLVKYSHPNFMMPIEKHQVIPNDTYFNNQYYLRNTGQIFNPMENHFGLTNADINASFAWTSTTGANNIIVAVIDEGVSPNHPDLPNARQVRLNGSNFVPGENANDPTPGLNNNHGNSCSGIIAATQNNNEGVTGIAPNVRIMPIKILGQNANADNNGLASAIDFAWQHGAHVISNSWGFQGVDNPNFVPAIVASINRAVTQGRGNLGCVVTFSASNSAHHNFGDNGIISFPSNVQINGVLTVGASDRDDEQADYSPTSNIASANNQIIDIVAPSHRAYPPAFGGISGEGFEVWTIDIPGNNGYNQWNDATFPGTAPAFGEVLPNFGPNNLAYTGRFGGTSAACPQVAAVAALILSMNNNLPQQIVFDIITQSAEDVGGYAYNANGWSPELGNGRLNACAALSRIPNRYSINGDYSLCTNSTYSIAGLPSGSTITWGSSNNNIATISPTGVATQVGIGNVTFTASINIPNRCGIATASKTVYVGVPQHDPNGGVYIFSYGEVCVGGGPYWFELVGAAVGADSYKWIVYGPSGGYYTNQVEHIELNFSQPGTHTIAVIPVNSCGEGAATYTSVEVSDWCGWGFTASPNPANNSVEVALDEQTVKNDRTMSIREIHVTDKLGNVVKQFKYGTGNKRTSLNISSLKSDVYFLRVFNGKEWKSKSIVKQ